MPIKFKYYILLFFPFFMLFYSEALNLGGVSISQLWKLPLAFYMAFYLFQHRHLHTPMWSQFQYWSSLKYLVNAGNITHIFPNLQLAIKFAFLPLLYNFINNKQWHSETLRKVLLLMSHYFILTNLPVMFGLKTIKTGHDYGNFVAYSGIFQNQHAMTIIMAICIVVILNDFKCSSFKKTSEKIYNIFLMCIAGYAMFLGFARTGWLMFILAVIVLYIPHNIRVKQWMGISFVLVTLVCVFLVLFYNSQLFHDRIVGNNIQTHEKTNFDSGRSTYSSIALRYYSQGSIVELLVGYSQEKVMDVIQKGTGMRIYAHNGFVNMIVSNGVIGLALMLLFAFSLLLFIYRRKKCQTYRLALAMWVMYISFQATQGGHMFHSDFLYALIFCILESENKESLEEKLKHSLC